MARWQSETRAKQNHKVESQWARPQTSIAKCQTPQTIEDGTAIIQSDA